MQCMTPSAILEVIIFTAYFIDWTGDAKFAGFGILLNLSCITLINVGFSEVIC